jgi:hypothetical protein
LIDGIKIKVHSINDATQWLDHAGLKFCLPPIIRNTGEILKGEPLISDYQGLTFRVTPTQKDPNKYGCHVLGSLHKYHNKGVSNANDFNLSNLKAVVKDLEKYHIDPSVSVFETVEFGVNIALPYPCQRVFDSLVSMPTKPFTELRMEKTNIGKRGEFQEYEIKVYDKGKAENGKDSSMLRVELRVKKSQYLNKVGIRTLSDATDKTKLLHAGAMLLKSLNEVILCDFDIKKLDTLTPSVREKVLQWSNPKWWQAWNRKQRYKELKDLSAFEVATDTGNVKRDLLGAIIEKWDNLLEEKGEALPLSLSMFIKNHYPKLDKAIQPMGENGSRFEDNLSKLEISLTGETSKNGDGFEDDLSKLEISLMDNLSNIEKSVLPKMEIGLRGKTSKNGDGFDKKMETVLIGKKDDLSIKINGYNVTSKKQQQNKKGVQGEKVTITTNGGLLYLGQRVCLTCKISIAHLRPQSIFCSDKCRKKKHNAERDRRKIKPTPSVPKPTEPKAPEPMQVFCIETELTKIAKAKKI